jgi:uncharacterized membrane protein
MSEAAAKGPGLPTLARYRIRELSVEAPWRWLAKGWTDLWTHPIHSLVYGGLFVVLGFAIAGLLWSAGLEALIPVAAGGFAIVGPLAAVGLYEKSRRLEEGVALTWPLLAGVRAASVTQLMYLGVFLGFGFLFWARIAQLIYALFVQGDYLPLDQFGLFLVTEGDGLAMLVIGSALGALIAFGIFLIAWISVPLLLAEDADFVTAMVLSVRAARVNWRVSLLWAFLIALFTGVGLATLLAGLVIVFPLLGHASWHAYRETIERA